MLLVRAALWSDLTHARDLIIDSAPILAWRRADPDAALGHAPAHHPRSLLLGYKVHNLLCRRTGLPLLFLLSPANVHDAPFARPLLTWTVRQFHLCPRVIRLDAGYWGLKLIAWIHTVLKAWAASPGIPSVRKNAMACHRHGLLRSWANAPPSDASLVGPSSSLQIPRPPVSGWPAVATRVTLTYAVLWVIALAAYQAGRPELIRSPRLVLAHVKEDME